MVSPISGSQYVLITNRDCDHCVPVNAICTNAHTMNTLERMNLRMTQHSSIKLLNSILPDEFSVEDVLLNINDKSPIFLAAAMNIDNIILFSIMILIFGSQALYCG